MSWSRSPGGPRGGRRPNRRQEIVEAAARLFHASGIAAVGPTDIAGELDLTPTAVRYHFPDADELLHDLFDPLLKDLERVTEAHGTARTDEQRRALLAEYVGVLLDHQQAAVLLDTDPLARTHVDFGVRLERINTRIRDVISGPDPDSRQQLGATAALGSLWRPLKRHSQSELRDQLDALLDVALTGPQLTFTVPASSSIESRRVLRRLQTLRARMERCQRATGSARRSVSGRSGWCMSTATSTTRSGR